MREQTKLIKWMQISSIIFASLCIPCYAYQSEESALQSMRGARSQELVVGGKTVSSWPLLAQHVAEAGYQVRWNYRLGIPSSIRTQDLGIPTSVSGGKGLKIDSRDGYGRNAIARPMFSGVAC